ncbi:MAG: amidohydrolase family protein [Planctomycetia bacterium]|nr:amidohydrolase family protein [Planctomycetia bacterium]
MKPYFTRTEHDEAFYAEHLRSRLPESIFDIHVHMNLPEHIAMVPEERWLSDWALEAGHLLPCDDAYACAGELYPDVEYSIAGFPWPIREADLVGNNAYLAGLRREGRLAPFMAVKPHWSIEETEMALVEGGFVGFKPYSDMATGVKGADVSIFDFFPHEQWQILDRHKKAVVLHLPRKGRIADDDNVRELLDAREKYPDVTIIIAHFGRAFCPVFLEQGLDKLGGADGFYFDTAAVINPAVYDVAFSRIPAERILYGSDMPILFWHGRREWSKREYHNLCREDFSWNTRRRSTEDEATYTLFLYEQMRAILDAVDRHGFGEADKISIFGAGARKALGLQQ